MWQIKINGILMPTIYWSFSEALAAIEHEKERFVAIITEVVHVDKN